MGFALAEACAKFGWDVELVCGPVKTSVSHPAIKRTDVESAQQMYEACMERFAACDAAILCAAVADFTVDQVAAQKIKRGPNGLEINLVPTKDIAASLGAIKQPHQRLVGFALETVNEVEHAQEKLRRKNLDFIVLNSLNDAGAGFAHDTNKVTIIPAEGEPIAYPLKPKTEVANDIIEQLCQLFVNS